MSACVNCNAPVESNYCPECGQKTKVLPIALICLVIIWIILNVN